MIILTILIGALIGWLAGKFMDLKLGFWKNAGLGILGSIVGDILGSILHFKGSLMNFILSVAGACIVVLIVRKLKSSK